ncbi:hypothetical protein BQ9231_00188 [Cedratvirus lausannensis]|uniref:F-box domain-containing protein n=1 Tax=Cedratvirus lausannensis TaxID=2023205 RepID=A0A285PWS0_9VIRU|nr:hypothetical protein BQ9231_00188 [Cedratvirus lausannensis]
MDLPLELNYKIIQDLPIVDLENLCATSQGAASFCSDVLFWQERFRREDLLLPRDLANVSSWIVEYKLSKIAQLRERHYMQNLLAKHAIILDLTRVNHVSILPDFLDKDKFAQIRDKRALQKNLSERPRKMLLLNRQDEIKLDVGEGLQILLTEQQARVLLFIFCYYELDPLTDRETTTYRVPRSQLEELGLVRPVPQWI